MTRTLGTRRRVARSRASRASTRSPGARATPTSTTRTARRTPGRCSATDRPGPRSRRRHESVARSRRRARRAARTRTRRACTRSADGELSRAPAPGVVVPGPGRRRWSSPTRPRGPARRPSGSSCRLRRRAARRASSRPTTPASYTARDTSTRLRRPTSTRGPRRRASRPARSPSTRPTAPRRSTTTRWSRTRRPRSGTVDRLTVYDSNQGGEAVRQSLARLFELRPERRAGGQSQHVGGGFGSKGTPRPNVVAGGDGARGWSAGR